MRHRAEKEVMHRRSYSISFLLRLQEPSVIPLAQEKNHHWVAGHLA